MGLGTRAAGAVRRHPQRSLAGLVVLLALPYALLGVGFVLDDWFWLRNGQFRGAVHASNPNQWLYRPGQGVVYALTFGLVGRHPLVLYSIQVGLAAVTAVLLYRLSREVLGEGRALGLSALWAVLPNHASLVNWASANCIAVALVLLLAGCLLLIAPRARTGTEVGAALLLAASVLVYEATSAAAVVAVLVLPRLARREWRWRQVAIAWSTLGAAGLWMAVHLDPDKAVLHARADFAQLLPAHFGWGVAPGALAPVVAVLGLAGLTVALLDVTRFRRRRVTADDRLVLAGLAVIVVGTLPFARYFYAPLGAGDRANVVAGIGTALAWLGIAGMAWRYRRPVAVGAGAFVLSAMVAAGVSGALAWHGAAASGRRIVAALAPAGGQLVVGPDPVLVRNVAPFLDDSNIQAAYQLRLGDPAATARISHADPDFAAVPPDLRLDLRCVPGTFEAARARCV